MPYVEVKKDGKLVARREVPDEDYTGSLTIRDGEEMTRLDITPGVVSRSGSFEARLISGDAPGTEQHAAEAEAVKPEIEGYEIVGKVGEGTGGTVWVAIQQGTRREVALKVLSPGWVSSKMARVRFEREIELSAELQHPNIAAVYDSGQSNGVYYYSMQLVQGRRLDLHAQDSRLDARAILEVMKTVSEAVQFAHSRGIIHRDLKPSNILVTREGHPYLVDFGLAKAVISREWDVEVTAQERAVGTPAYMSPEQAEGKHHLVGTRSDVYSLGVILYRLLVGKPPHDLTGTQHEVIHRITHEEVRRPRAFDAGLNREIEAILLKTLAMDPERRYTSAGSFARDIGRYLTGEPIEAKRDSRLYVMGKVLRRNKAVVVLAAVFALLVTVSFVLVSSLYVQSRKAHLQAERARDTALEARDATSREAARNTLLVAKILAQQRDLVSAHQWLMSVPKLPELEQEWRWAAWEYLRRSRELDRVELADALPSALLWQARESTTPIPVVVSPLAGLMHVGGSSGDAVVLDLRTGAVAMGTAGAAPPVDPMNGYALQVEETGPDRARVMLRDEHGATWVLDGAPRRTISATAMSNGGDHLAIGYRNGLIEGWRLASGSLEPAFTIDGYREACVALAFSPDGQELLGVSEGWVCRTWALERDGDVTRMTAHEDTTRRLSFSPDGRWLASGSYDGHLKIWDRESLQPMVDIPAYEGSRLGVRQIVFTADGKQVLMTGGDEFISRWDWSTGKRLSEMRVDESFTSFVMDRKGERLYARGGTYLNGDEIIVFDALRSRELKRCGEKRPNIVIYDLAVHPTEPVVFAAMHPREASMEPACDVWDVEACTKLRSLIHHDDGLRAVDVSPSGDQIAVASRDGTATLWNWRTGELEHELEIKRGRAESNIVSSVRYHPTRPFVVTASHDNRVIFWSTTTGRQLATLSVDEDQELAYRTYGALKEVVFSPDGSWLAITVGRDIWMIDLTYHDSRIDRLAEQWRRRAG